MAKQRQTIEAIYARPKRPLRIRINGESFAFESVRELRANVRERLPEALQTLLLAGVLQRLPTATISDMRTLIGKSVSFDLATAPAGERVRVDV